MRTRRIVPFALFPLAAVVTILTAPALAEHRDGWDLLQPGETCIGGDRCGGLAIGYGGGYNDTVQLPLDRRPIEAIRFFAHDNVGRHRDGKLRVEIGREVLADWVDIERRGRWYEIDAHGARGPFVAISAQNHDEVVISDVSVLYAGRSSSDRDFRSPRFPDRDFRNDGRSWLPIDIETCIGGERCGYRNGDVLEVALSGQPLRGVRFYAHDAVGRQSRGTLLVVLDNEVVGPRIDVARDGRWYEIDAGGLPARLLTLEAASNDEVVIERVELLYAGGHRGSVPRGHRRDRDWRNR